jgi:BirA family biotin operon repressor/biotin-[acetyl-CoA-carboxylase] ligase
MNNYFKHIDIVDSIDSTNKELKKDKYNQYDNYVLIANQQTNGTGRLTRTFVSNKDVGLYMSIRIKPNISIDKLNNITCVVASIVSTSIEKQIERLVDIKWVNDIYINNFKVAGILVESKINFNTNQFDYLIIGIGVNLYNQEFDDELSKIASNIEKETNIKISKKQLIEDILFELSNYLKDYNFEEYMKQYISRSFIIGKKIKLQTPLDIIECTVEDINYNGELIINHNNTIEIINSAEVIKTHL